MIDTFPQVSDELDAAKIPAPRIVDPQNADQIDSHLTLSNDKEAMHALFGG